MDSRLREALEVRDSAGCGSSDGKLESSWKCSIFARGLRRRLRNLERVSWSPGTSLVSWVGLCIKDMVSDRLADGFFRAG